MARYNEMGDRLYPCVNGVGWDTKNADHRDIVCSRLALHAGEYDPQHWGELDPDAYDRQGWQTKAVGSWDEPYAHGRHLLHTGTE